MISPIYQVALDVPFGKVTLSASEYYLQGIDLFQPPQIPTQDSPILQQLTREIELFFEEAHNSWSIPLMYTGTDFQQRVWQYLSEIPLGETRSYSDAAKVLDTSARAIGNACHANPFPIVVPCHRIVSKSGIGGFAGKTEGHEINVKQWLLDHEQRS